MSDDFFDSFAHTMNQRGRAEWVNDDKARKKTARDVGDLTLMRLVELKPGQMLIRTPAGAHHILDRSEWAVV